MAISADTIVQILVFVATIIGATFHIGNKLGRIETRLGHMEKRVEVIENKAHK